MKLSIIICVYNTAKEYITACLDSITGSTLERIKGDYEICFVDDGSSIDYSDIVKKYGVKYLRTENRGIFSARKTGLSMASGDYVAYCDSDDTVSYDYHLPMLERAIEKDADIVINDWAFHTEKAKYYSLTDITVNTEMSLSGEDCLKAFLSLEGRQHSLYVLWNKVYKTLRLREAFETLSCKGYPDSYSYAEDATINFFAWKEAKRVENIHTGYYFYRIHSSQSVTVASEEKLKNQIIQMNTSLNLMRDAVDGSSELLSYIEGWSALMARSHYSEAKGSGYTELYPLIKQQYGISKLSVTKYEDDGCGVKKLLGDNFELIDSMLLELSKRDTALAVYAEKPDLYTSRALARLENDGKIRTVQKKNADLIIPKPKNSAKQRLLHNPIVYKISLILFKKGSRIRKFLKKFI